MRGSAGSGGSTHRFCFTGCLGSTETERRITPRKTQGNILGEDVGVGGSLLLLDPKSMAAHLTLPGRQKEKTVLGWRRSQSLSQQQFKSQVPGVKSQTQIGKAVQDKVKRDEAPQSFPADTTAPTGFVTGQFCSQNFRSEKSVFPSHIPPHHHLGRGLWSRSRASTGSRE